MTLFNACYLGDIAATSSTEFLAMSRLLSESPSLHGASIILVKSQSIFSNLDRLPTDFLQIAQDIAYSPF